MNKGWMKNSINRLLVKFRTVDRRLRSGRRSAHTSDVVLETKVLVSRRLEDKNTSLGLGLGLETQSLGLGLGLEIKVLVLILVLTKKSCAFSSLFRPC